jgi:hypothetical protein
VPDGLDDAELNEEAGKAWVLDALEALDDQSFVFVMSSVGALTRALLITEPRPETTELAAAIDVYLGTRGVTLPF